MSDASDVDLGDVIQMTRKGRRAVKAGRFPPGMSPEVRLVAAIVSMTNGRPITAFNVTAIMDELLARHDGDFEAATDTVLSGRVRLDPCSQIRAT
jgi:hypothetical protein